MKNLTLALTLLMGAALFAQPKDMQSKKEKFDAMRIAYITQEVALTPEEAQVFWPIYNERNAKLDALRSDFKQALKKLKQEGKTIDDLSDAELDKLMKNRMKSDKEIAQINEDYHAKIVSTIGLRKTAKLYMAEIQFQRELLSKGREHGGPNGKGKPGGM